MLDEMSKAKKELYEENFSKRLSELRRGKGVSARKMSLALGQNAGYINHMMLGSKELKKLSDFLYSTLKILHNPFVDKILHIYLRY